VVAGDGRRHLDPCFSEFLSLSDRGFRSLRGTKAPRGDKSPR
jgi:hypothetical protein